MTALQLREEVARLEAERALPISAGIDKAHAYMADLEEELEICRSAFVVEAVVETRRAVRSPGRLMRRRRTAPRTVGYLDLETPASRL
jgi:hypothetical protein